MQGIGAIHAACMAGRSDLVDLLLGLEPGLVEQRCGPLSKCPEWMPLHSAVESRKPHLLRVLLEARAGINEVCVADNLLEQILKYGY